MILIDDRAVPSDLHARIARALGWTERDATSFSLQSLRDLVRPVDPGLAREIDDEIRSGRYLTRRNRARAGRGRGGRVENEYGLTFPEWLAAAGGRAHVDAVIAFGMTAREAWRGGEDPTEYRAADSTRIRALKERQNMTSHNMARGSSRKNPLTAPTRVATLAQLGVSFDPNAFYSVKGGKLYERQRTGGGGYGRGRLGKTKLLGTIPGFKKTLFYSVKNGVVFARKRK